ncbi:MAG: hypothetical protein II424_01755 [Bacteroidales bacterium]|nr:hypothetical protein [Bacteroidales bacterium]
MRLTKSILILCAISALACEASVLGQNDTTAAKSRLTVGGYGEAVFSRHFYSDNVFRYSHADRYKEAPAYSRLDLPHAVIMLGYDFGHGWSIGTEIEFEHGGIEAAVEKETEETGEFEQEIERGGEVALEQFWVQKSFGKAFNIRAGHIVVPVGMTNANHLPTQFFGLYRPEGENTIMPWTWHETGVSLWGKAGSWRYEVQLLPALNSNLFNDAGWVHNGSASPYEFRPANSLAGAARVDWTGVQGLRLSVSGYIGNTFNNDITTTVYPETSRYYGATGTLLIGCFDFAYKNRWLTVRGNVDYGHLGDASLISTRNKNQTTMTGNPYPHTAVGESAWDASLEAGVNLLAWSKTTAKLYLFGRYDHYDSFVPAEGWTDVEWAERQVVSAGVNYYPLPEIAIKAEGGIRLLSSQYNNEPYFALGITWAGFFKK